jgi:DNA primase
VSTPLSWDEVNSKLDRHAFTIHTIRQRLEQVGDLFEELFNVKIQKKNAGILNELMSVDK